MVVAATQTGIWDWDMQTNRIYYCPSLKASLGYEESEISDAPAEWESRLHPDDKARALALVDDYLSGRIACYELEHRMRHKDGTYRWFHTCAVLQRDEQGHPRRMTGSHVDITERKRLQAQLRRTERVAELGTVASGMAHEIGSIEVASATRVHRQTVHVR